MKCPYRKTTTYKCKEQRNHDSSGNFYPHLVDLYCTARDAHFVEEDFMQCLEKECPCYANGKCKKAEGESKGEATT